MDKTEFEAAILKACGLLNQQVTYLQVLIQVDKEPVITAVMEAPASQGKVH